MRSSRAALSLAASFLLALIGSVLIAVPEATAATAKPPPIKHVFVINLENENYDDTFGPTSQMPYLSQTLVGQGALLSQYYGIGHVSLDNYIAQISGQGPSKQTQTDCTTYSDFVSTGTGDFGQALGDGCVYPKSVKTIAGQLLAKKLTWGGYMEDMSSPCQHPDLGAKDQPLSSYVTRHNPFVYFHSIVDSPSCAKNDVPLERLDHDLKSVKTTPNLTYITPNNCHNGHDRTCADGTPGGPAVANGWLQQWVPKILAAPAFKKDGLLVVTFDEAESTDDSSACCNTPTYPNVDNASSVLPGPGGGRTGAVLVSPFIEAGTKSDTPYNHFALLCSVESIFGLSKLGYAGQPGLTCFGKDVYTGSSGTGSSGTGSSK